jgi:hypothetical protein
MGSCKRPLKHNVSSDIHTQTHTQVLAPDAVREMEPVGDADQDTLRVTEADNDVEREMEMVLVAEMDDASFTSPASVLSTWVQGRVG